MGRRDFLESTLGLTLAGSVLSAATWGSGCKPSAVTGDSSSAADETQPGEEVLKMGEGARMPVGFVGHGAPTLAIDPGKGGDLTRWANQMPEPRAILVISAHWEDTPATAGTTSIRDLMYDFYGFPDELYELEYKSPGAPELVERLSGLIPGGVAQEDRPLDHGVWVPLLHMAPRADIPVLQLSLPSQQGAEGLFELGRKLAALRDEGVFILGSGNIVHNLGRLRRGEGPAPRWATEFDQWATEVLAGEDFDALIDYRQDSPGLRLAHPTEEHFQPLLVAAGAASMDGGQATFPVEGFEYGSISRRCVQFG
jgi:4,5-DOPA dioxygenase extradiol